MFANLRRRWSLKRLAQHVRTPSIARPVVTLEDTKRVLLLVESTDLVRFGHLMEYARRLAEGGIAVHVCTVCLSKQVPSELLMRKDLILIDRRSVDFLYRPTGEQARRLTELVVDYLIDFCNEPPLTLQWVLAQSHAVRKVSFRPAGFPPVDISLLGAKSRSIGDLSELLSNQLSLLSGLNRV